MLYYSNGYRQRLQRCPTIRLSTTCIFFIYAYPTTGLPLNDIYIYIYIYMLKYVSKLKKRSSLAPERAPKSLENNLLVKVGFEAEILK